MKFQIFLCALFLLYSSWIVCGFAKGTLIKVPTGYCEIENLKVGDWVCAVRLDGNATLGQIDQIVCYTWHKYMKLDMDDDISIVMATGQKLYQPLTHTWIKAKHVEQGTPLLSGVDQVRHVTSALKIHEPIEVFDIKMKDVHTFCVSQHDIVVHNYALLTIGLSIAWGLSKIAFERLLREICIVGLALLGKHVTSNGQSQGQNWKIETVRRTFIFGEKPILYGNPALNDFSDFSAWHDDSGPVRYLQSLSSDEFLKLCRYTFKMDYVVA
ncbi:MAG TPA: polymorphic toxin-type HINT domain-containing protein [Candidatus Saccharimonadales bacterium]|nr:polymorphic toxin-type HINT domain-containing protein [Candidatus Saccharimonadales bacterium]